MNYNNRINVAWMPGLVDLHVHFRDPGFTYKEDVVSGSKAAAHGGFTHVLCMPNTDPVIDTPNKAMELVNRGNEVGLVRVMPAGALTFGLEGDELTDFRGFKDIGITALSDDGKTPQSYGIMENACKRARELGMVVFDHVDNADTLKRDVELSKNTGCRIHLQHIHSKVNVDLLRKARIDGVNITAETAPHYFALTERAVERFGANATMNPPLGTEEDRLAVLKGIKERLFDAIATDHAPHSVEDKEGANPPNGVIGLETSFAVSYTILVRGGIMTFRELMRYMCLNPLRILGLKQQDGTFTLFDIKEPFIVDKNTFLSKGRNTPFDGMELYGQVLRTVNNGVQTWAEPSRRKKREREND